MQQDHFSARYSRQLQLPGFGTATQQKLQSAKVLVVGAGGLGMPALFYLAGMGIGTIGIVDADVVSLSNLHRQVLYTTAEIGQLKVQVAAAKLALLNPDIVLHPYPVMLSPDNALNLIGDYDLVLDATDNFSARYLINDACVILHKPFIYGAVHQYEGYVSVFNLADGPTYRCLYPTSPTVAEIPDCNTAGVLGVVPGIIGCRQALEAVKVITGIGNQLSGYLQVYDFLQDEQYKIKLQADPVNKSIKTLAASYALPSCILSTSLHPQELQTWLHSKQEFILIDVREPDEFMNGHLPGAKNIPLSTLSITPFLTATDTPMIVYCQKGNRSAKAVQLLQQQQPTRRIFALAGGLDNWLKK